MRSCARKVVTELLEEIACLFPCCFDRPANHIFGENDQSPTPDAAVFSSCCGSISAKVKVRVRRREGTLLQQKNQD